MCSFSLKSRDEQRPIEPDQAHTKLGSIKKNSILYKKTIISQNLKETDIDHLRHFHMIQNEDVALKK